jgi:formyltetrahydrofolate-dependent phosphoribosylglycinamide formyltransferase|tara:strand:- start:1905 stop:2492 length:588 start_codon:yes stop_codon:yes gene_type:complete
MEKLNGKKKLRVSVFISGRGTNLKSIINFSKRKSSPFKVVLIITNNKNAKGINFAKKNKIKYLFVNYKNKNNAESKILINLKNNNISFICLAGFMKILSKKIINTYKNKILNIHPSLLPKYKGLNTHKRVIKNKEKFTGCTVHLVNSKLDEGKIILQKKVRVLKKDNENSLSKRVLKIENLIYPRAIKKFINSNL